MLTTDPRSSLAHLNPRALHMLSGIVDVSGLPNLLDEVVCEVVRDTMINVEP